MHFLRTVVLAVLLGLAACATPPAATGPAARPAAADTASATAPRLLPRYPLGVADYRTTDPGIYVGNLDAQVLGLREAWGRSGSADHEAALGGALLQRFRIRGRLEDAEEALARLAAAARRHPGVVQTAVLHAAALGVFHRFDEARAELERAAALAPGDAFLRRTAREIDLATGDYDRVADLLGATAEPPADIYELALRADVRASQGDLAGASHLLMAAQGLYADVDPYHLAWLHTQQGILLLRFGEVERAREFFAAAHERIPQYYLAAEHLAETDFLLGRLDAARERYRAVIEATGNPEFWAALGEVEAEAGRGAEAAAAFAKAREGYEAQLARHRAATLQHAAEFFLGLGETARALELARENLAIRRDAGSLVLLADTAHAAGRSDESCDALRRVQATGLAPPEYRDSPARAGCADRAPRQRPLAPG